MNFLFLSGAANAKAHKAILISIWTRLQNAADAQTAKRINTVETPDITMVRDFIKSLIAANRLPIRHAVTPAMSFTIHSRVATATVDNPAFTRMVSWRRESEPHPVIVFCAPVTVIV